MTEAGPETQAVSGSTTAGPRAAYPAGGCPTILAFTATVFVRLGSIPISMVRGSMTSVTSTSFDMGAGMASFRTSSTERDR